MFFNGRNAIAAVHSSAFIMISFVCVSFSLSASQEEVYCVCAKHIILSTLEGYNGSLIAYGQTGNASYEFLIIIYLYKHSSFVVLYRDRKKLHN